MREPGGVEPDNNAGGLPFRLVDRADCISMTGTASCRSTHRAVLMARAVLPRCSPANTPTRVSRRSPPSTADRRLRVWRGQAASPGCPRPAKNRGQGLTARHHHRQRTISQSRPRTPGATRLMGACRARRATQRIRRGDRVLVFRRRVVSLGDDGACRRRLPSVQPVVGGCGSKARSPFQLSRPSSQKSSISECANTS